jgi:cyclic di-GMP phosphodiesterase
MDMTSERVVSILIVDDENGVRELMTRWLEAGGMTVRAVSNADEALGCLETMAPAVALCDIRMPGHDGVWLAGRIRERSPETAVIMATGVQDIGPAVDSLRRGVVDYLTKPFGRQRLQEAVARGLDWHRAAWDARRWRETLESEMDVRRARLEQAMVALDIDGDAALDAVLAMVTLGDRDAYTHAHRVAELAVRLAAALGITDEECSTIRRAALLHDLGKLALPDAILRKPAPLTVEEHELVRRHPQIGRELAARVPFLAGAAPIVADAHQRIEGGSNQDTATGPALAGRIVAVADAFDTMTRPRVFRDPLPRAEALLELERCKGTQFDAAVVDAFVKLTA